MTQSLDPKLATTELYRKSLYDFTKAAWPYVEPETFVESKYVQVLCSHYEWVYRTGKNLVINLPVRHLKSTLGSVMFPPWVWANNPKMSFLNTTHSRSLTLRDAVKARSLIQSDWYTETFGKISFHQDQNVMSRYKNLQGGSRQSVSVESKVTGDGAHIRIIDDLVDATKAYNRSTLQNAEDYYKAFYSRTVTPDYTPIICVMQRLAKDDLTEYLLKTGEFYHLVLPMKAELDHPYRSTTPPEAWPKGMTGEWRKEGEMLFPELWTMEMFEKWSMILGSRASGQLQQRPANKEGALFNTDYLHRYEEIPPIKLKKMICDTAEKKGERNDYSVLAIYGLDHKDNLYILDLIRRRMTSPELLRTAKAFIAKHNAHDYDIQAISEIVIEEKSSGTGLIQYLREDANIRVPIKAIARSIDKTARANNVIPTYEQSGIYLPAKPTRLTDAAWVADYETEMANFSNDDTHQFDDQVDTTMDAIELMQRALNTKSFMTMF